ncbi:MAG: MCE family protein, partial [Solirubrobacterales bacterium]|nr:MCE family protein [Solirubrobacterales bacterium]
MQRVLTPRLAVPAVLGLALVVVLLVLVGPGGGSYEVVARFRDAGQLVKGGDVQVAGGRVGSIQEIRLGDDGIAEVVLGVSDELAPLHAGTKAEIRSLGLSGVANRYVNLSPGPDSGATIEDGGRLELPTTTGIV